MSDFKIIGNANPEIGKEEFYSVDKFLPEVLPFQTGAKTNRVQWEIYILENGKWRKTKENDKSGNIVSFKFLQKSLDRKGIRILARRGEDTGRMDIKTHPAGVPKIDSIELLDKNGQKPSKPLSYGQTLKARVHCLHMEKRKVSVTLWEDDVNGSGHAHGNEKNIMQTLSGVVKNGKADVDFLLRPSFAKIAKKDGKEDKIHEYYVTTDFNREKLASKNVNVNDLETPVAPFKRKVPVQQRSHPAAPVKQPVLPKTNTPASNAPAKKEKGEITNVHLTDTDGRAITGTFKQKQIKVWIDSKGLIGKDIRLKLFDEDGLSDDLLFDEKFTIKSNIYSVVIPLNEIPRSKGGGYWGEGAEQEVFAYVEVIQTGKHKESKIIDVDATVFKPDPVEVTNKVSKVGEESDEEKKKENKGKCTNCDKDITLDEIKKICVDAKGNCLIDNETMIKAALPHLNKYRKKVNINTCVRKAHFLAQISEESKFYCMQENLNWYWKSLIDTFKSYFKQFRTLDEKETEAKRLGRPNLAKTPGLTLDQQMKLANAIYGKTHPNGKLHVNSGDGWLYSGKGFKQITWKSNYQELAKYFNANMKIDNESDVEWTDGNNPYKLKNNAKDAITSALAYWGRNNINSVASKNSNDAVSDVTAKINAKKEGLAERKRYFKKAVEILKVNNCTQGEEIITNEGTVVVVSGTDTKKEKDPAQNIYWIMYKTSVYKDMSMATYKKLQSSKKLPKPSYITYLSRDTHQVKSSNGEVYKHSNKRFGQYNEIPVGEYFLVPGVSGQKYQIYVIDSEQKSAAAQNGIVGVDGDRGGVALHQYCPRFSVGCFTFNSGKNKQPISDFIEKIPDLSIGDNRPVRFIVESRKVEESVWSDSKYGTKKWKGI